MRKDGRREELLCGCVVGSPFTVRRRRGRARSLPRRGVLTSRREVRMARKGTGKLPQNAGPSDAERAAKARREGIGEGMTSPDSTQMPLRADTGEPDWEAVPGRRPGGRPGEP